MATFVLVHGTGHGGWCWRSVVPLLRAAGHEVYTPTLTGVGERAHLLAPTVDLSTHIADVANLLYYEDLSEVALVGHSYAGMVVTGVAGAAPERLSRLIYLDAYIPSAGESWYDLQPPGWADSLRAELAGSWQRPPGDPVALGVTDPALVGWMQARLTPHPLATYEQRLPEGSPMAAGIPGAYIHCTQGPGAPRFAGFAALAEERGWPVRYLATGHDAMLSAPEQVARLITELAG
jgi:pimeloyl-ACP methyl ester carboxylesterase